MALPQRSIAVSDEQWEFTKVVARQARIHLRVLIRQGMKAEAERLIAELGLDAEAIRKLLEQERER